MLTPYGFPQNGAVLQVAVKASPYSNIANLDAVPLIPDVIGDGVVKEGDFFLLRNQYTMKDNGVYILGPVKNNTAPLKRHSDVDNVLANGGQVRVCLLGSPFEFVSMNNGPVAIGVGSILFASTEPPPAYPPIAGG